MELRRLGDSNNRWTFDVRCEWLQLFHRCNWYTLTLLRVEIENEAYAGNVNYTLGLLGFVVYGSYTYNPALMDEIMKKSDAWFDEQTSRSEAPPNDKEQ